MYPVPVSSNFNFNELPFEVHVKILSKIPRIEKDESFDKMILVSKKWMEAIPIAKKDWFYKERISLSIFANSAEDAIQIVFKERLKSANLVGFYLINSTLSQLAVKCRHLKSLDLYWCAKISEKTLATTLSLLANLKKLRVSACNHFNNDHLIKEIFNRRNLKELDLKWCPNMYSTNSSNLSKLLKLKRLNLSGCEKLIEDVSFFSKFPNLKRLDLEEVNITTVHIVSIFSFLTQLEMLNLSDCILDPVNASELNSLKKHENLELLNLSRVRNWYALSELFPKMTHLKHLVLNEVFAVGEELMKVLSNLPEIQILDIAMTRIPFMIEEFKEPHLNLHTLNISGGYKYDNGELIPLISNFPHLKFLDVSNRYIPDTSPLLDEIENLLPELEEIIY